MKKNITHINLAKGFRGGERQTLLLIEELSKRGYVQKLIVRKGSVLSKKILKIPDLQIQEISKPFIFNLYKFRNENIIHAHETKGAQIGFLINLLFKVNYLITRRVDHEIKKNFFNIEMYSRASKNIALSKIIKNEILKISTINNIEIIPSAFSKCDPNLDIIFQLKKRFKNKYLIGHIGELNNDHKGQKYLIEAAKKLENEYPNIHFIFLGKGKDRDLFFDQAKEMKNITFEGFVKNVNDYIEIFDLFVFPSLYEGLGSSLLDVMQHKVPIIATNVGGIPDIIQNNSNGILIDSKNSQQIYEAIKHIYLNPKIGEKLAINGHETIDQFSKKAMCNAYERIYCEL